MHLARSIILAVFSTFFLWLVEVNTKWNSTVSKTKYRRKMVSKRSRPYPEYRIERPVSGTTLCRHWVWEKKVSQTANKIDSLNTHAWAPQHNMANRRQLFSVVAFVYMNSHLIFFSLRHKFPWHDAFNATGFFSLHNSHDDTLLFMRQQKRSEWFVQPQMLKATDQKKTI